MGQSFKTPSSRTFLQEYLSVLEQPRQIDRRTGQTLQKEVQKESRKTIGQKGGNFKFFVKEE